GGIVRLNLAGTADGIVSADGGSAQDIATGPDGSLWYTLPDTNAIGHVPSLFFNRLDVPNGAPLGIAHGPDDSIWIADAGGNRVSRIGANGSLVQNELQGGTPTGIAVAADGSAWFTLEETNAIGRLTAEGDLTEFVIPAPDTTPQGIALGP